MRNKVYMIGHDGSLCTRQHWSGLTQPSLMQRWHVGLLADKLIKQGWHITKVRKTLQTVAFLGPALALIILSRSKDPRMAVACMTCALGITSLGQSLCCCLWQAKFGALYSLCEWRVSNMETICCMHF